MCDVLKEQRNIMHEIRKRKANWIGHILRRNCLLQRVIEGKIQGGIEVTGRQGRRRTKLLDDLKERRGYSHLKEEALDRTMWRARFGRGFGPVVRQTTKRMTDAWSMEGRNKSFKEMCLWKLLPTRDALPYIRILYVDVSEQPALSSYPRRRQTKQYATW